MIAPEDKLIAATSFLTHIGLQWQWQAGATGFTEHLDIRCGILLVDPRARVSGVLHEAGHLATLPGDFRPLAQRNIGGIQRLMLESIDFSEPDGELQRAAIQCSDPEATAWAWAAGEHLGFAPEDIIRDDEYDNSGAILRMQLGQRAYLGINGLSHAGFCAVRAGLYAEKRGLPAYPRMKHWLQRDFGHTGAAELRARLVPAA